MECQDCFSTDLAIVETEIICCNCGTVVENNNIAPNSCEFAALGNYEFRNPNKRVDKFELLLKDIDFKIKEKMKKDFINLEQKFNNNRDKIERKNFFTNRIILQKLLEHHKLSKPVKLTSGQRKHYKQFTQLDWPDSIEKIDEIEIETQVEPIYGRLFYKIAYDDVQLFNHKIDRSSVYVEGH